MEDNDTQSNEEMMEGGDIDKDNKHQEEGTGKEFEGNVTQGSGPGTANNSLKDIAEKQREGVQKAEGLEKEEKKRSSEGVRDEIGLSRSGG